MTKSRLALVTGAASGIGLALSRILSERQHRLHLFDIDGDELAVATSGLDVETATTGDVADPTAMQALADQIGAVDLLCLNAGVTSISSGAPWDASPQEWQRVLGVNLVGVVNGLRSFVPRMLEREHPGQILITASLAGVTTWPGGGPYAASKHAVLAVAEQAALELAETHLSVTVLCPALVRTGMSDAGEDPLVVAEQALAAAGRRQFAVIPDDWAPAVLKRGMMLTSGGKPETPIISASD